MILSTPDSLSPLQPSSSPDPILENLIANACSMTKSLEKQFESKEAKKSKRDSLEPFVKQMILNASATSSEFSAEEPTAELLAIMNYSSLARSQTMLNFYLHKAKYHVDVPLSLVTALIGGHWILRGSADPGHVHFSIL